MLSAYENELLAILFAVKIWHYYLVDRRFIIRTDQQSLKYLLEQRITTPLHHTWLTKLFGIDYEMTYKEGTKNVAVDALSRLPEVALHSLTMSFMPPALFAQIRASWSLDSDHRRILQHAKDGSGYVSFSWKDDFLWRKSKLVVGPDKALRSEL